MINRFLRITVILAGLALLLPLPATAGTPLPIIHEPEGEGVECVEPEEVMRRDHMNFILHQRDETMYKGIRGAKHSLKDCIDCHAGYDDSGKPVPINAEGSSVKVATSIRL